MFTSKKSLSKYNFNYVKFYQVFTCEGFIRFQKSFLYGDTFGVKRGGGRRRWGQKLDPLHRLHKEEI